MNQIVIYLVNTEYFLQKCRVNKCTLILLDAERNQYDSHLQWLWFIIDCWDFMRVYLLHIAWAWAKFVFRPNKFRALSWIDLVRSNCNWKTYKSNRWILMIDVIDEENKSKRKLICWSRTHSRFHMCYSVWRAAYHLTLPEWCMRCMFNCNACIRYELKIYKFVDVRRWRTIYFARVNGKPSNHHVFICLDTAIAAHIAFSRAFLK